MLDLLLVVTVSFILMEAIELVSFLCYRPSQYFSKLHNFADWLAFLIALEYLFEITGLLSLHSRMTGVVTIAVVFDCGLCYL